MGEIKRYIFRCAICHNVSRKAKPSLYCSDACKQVAWRRRKAAQREAAALAALAEVERQELAAEALRQRRAEAERQRQEAERQRAAEAERTRREEAERQARAEAEAKRQRILMNIAPACPKCGARLWRFSWHKNLLTGWQTKMTCKQCGASIKPTVSPSPCTCGHGALGVSYYDMTLDGEGVLTCHMCKQEYELGEWFPKWTPGNSLRLAEGVDRESLKRQHFNPVYRPTYRPPRTWVLDDEESED